MGYIRRGFAKVRPAAGKIKRVVLWGTFGIFSSSILLVIALKWFPVYLTPLVLLRGIEATTSGNWVSIQKDWVSIDEISPHLQKAVIASEDPKFLSHNGFDFEAIAKAIDANKKRKIKMGASTISQQTAKNVFL